MKKILNSIKSKYIIPIVLIIIGIILLAIPSKKAESSVQNTELDILSYANEIETKLTELLLKVDGIEEVNVMITFENIGEQVMAENKSSSSSEYVIISGGDIDQGIKLTEIFPTVRGASIVCTNGNDAVVKEKITSLVSSALGIPTNRITVAG